MECYFWGLGVYFEPQYLLGLRFLMKVSAIITVADDIYDAYGTIEELVLLTEAVERLIGYLHFNFISIISELMK